MLSHLNMIADYNLSSQRMEDDYLVVGVTFHYILNTAVVYPLYNYLVNQ